MGSPGGSTDITWETVTPRHRSVLLLINNNNSNRRSPAGGGLPWIPLLGRWQCPEADLFSFFVLGDGVGFAALEIGGVRLGVF